MPELTPKLGIKKPLGNETVSRAAFNENWDIIDANVVADKGNVPSIQAGLDANKPDPGTAGRLYVATDTQIIYRDTGTAWQKVGVVKWGDIEGKPSSFPPSAHKSTHASGGSDPITPADIGAVNKAGDTMTGLLTFNSVLSLQLAGNATTTTLTRKGIYGTADPDGELGFVTSGWQINPRFTFYMNNGGTITQWAQIDGTGIKVRGYTVWHAGNDGAGSGLDADKLDGVELVDIHSPTRGTVTYTDTIPANSTLTKTIAIGKTAKHGRVFITGPGGGVISFFNTTSGAAITTGAYSIYGVSYPQAGNAWSGTVVDRYRGALNYNYGNNAVSNNSDINLIDIYISGSNIILVFQNVNASNAYALNTTIIWEVW
ncbi:MAG: hypothetical protein ACPLRZ_07580 [Thermovenabulum sp.]|uniref:hypothetical protein n=1 Tax=Thermovenabulum sp. TaxID=3100335 RepID=UPI003C7D6FFD